MPDLDIEKNFDTQDKLELSRHLDLQYLREILVTLRRIDANTKAMVAEKLIVMPPNPVVDKAIEQKMKTKKGK